MIPRRIVAIGASSCEGQVDPDHGGFMGHLYRWHGSQSDRHHVYNLGISGDTSTGILKRIVSECKLRRPHLIICQIGANDTLHEGSLANPTSTPLGHFEENIREIITQARTLADVMFVSVHPIDDTKTQPVWWGSYFYTQKEVAQYAAVTKRVCDELKVPYVNVFDELVAQDYSQYLHSDGLHANALGHAFIFEKLKAKIEEVYLK